MRVRLYTKNKKVPIFKFLFMVKQKKIYMIGRGHINMYLKFSSNSED